jgi:hypothetical protein
MWLSKKTTSLISITVVILIAGFIVIILPGITRADFNLTTSPLPVTLTTTPGGTISSDLRVQNSGTTPVQLKVNLLKFKANGENGQPQLLQRETGDDFFDWVTFSKASFLAEPGVWNTVTMTIATPTTAAFGYYYAVVFSEDNSSQPTTAPNANTLSGATATLVLLDVQAPGAKRQLDLVSFSTDKKLYEYLPTTFNIRVNNSGNVHAVPIGNIYISRDHKNTIAVLNVNEAAGNILPDSSRTFQTNWEDGFPVYTVKRDNGQIVSDKNGNPEQQLNWDFSKISNLRFGRYYAHLLLIYDDGTKDIPLEAEVSFWVVPWKMLPLVLLVVIMIFVGIWSTGRGVLRRVRRKKNDKQLSIDN